MTKQKLNYIYLVNDDGTVNMSGEPIRKTNLKSEGDYTMGKQGPVLNLAQLEKTTTSSLLKEINSKLNSFKARREQFTKNLEKVLFSILVTDGDYYDNGLFFRTPTEMADSSPLATICAQLNKFYPIKNEIAGYRLLCFQEDNYVLMVKYQRNMFDIRYKPYITENYKDYEFIKPKENNNENKR